MRRTASLSLIPNCADKRHTATSRLFEGRAAVLRPRRGERADDRATVATRSTPSKDWRGAPHPRGSRASCLASTPAIFGLLTSLADALSRAFCFTRPFGRAVPSCRKHAALRAVGESPTACVRDDDRKVVDTKHRGCSNFLGREERLDSRPRVGLLDARRVCRPRRRRRRARPRRAARTSPRLTRITRSSGKPRPRRSIHWSLAVTLTESVSEPESESASASASESESASVSTRRGC
jgi:hypothetical protein